MTHILTINVSLVFVLIEFNYVEFLIYDTVPLLVTLISVCVFCISTRLCEAQSKDTFFGNKCAFAFRFLCSVSL